GQRVVVVGDDEQVSPSAIGEGALDVRELQREWLDGFPDQDLFDGRASAYEIARRSFPGGLIRLTEHFRCVPDIIRFSNALCYDGEIKPLREAASGHVFPAVVAHQVLGGERGAGSKVNRVEALEVASLVVAVTEEPAYKGLELGVISLLGGEQAKEIDSLLQRFLDPATYHARRLVCGTAPHFQGDERDVMFVSLVDSGADKGPLRLVERDDLKKRYNVAVSRARDQLWVVHSLNPDKDLKADDLRRKLIEHAINPLNTPHEETAATSSALAEEIRRRLTESGYFVESDLDVGAYHVHLVVTGASGRVAIQCAGEQRSLTDLDSELSQEAVLARLGWSFIRLPGSSYYRDPDGELLRLMQRLEERGIKAGSAGDAPLRSVVRDEGLVRRLLERATEIRNIWTKNAGGFDALFAAKRVSKAARAKAALNAQRTEPHLIEADTERNLITEAS
ncbi:MAG: AAA domain-containing protein, partial [Myxococcaceae bacterium]